MMGLAKRIIPTLLVRGRQLVKGQQFNAWRSVGHAVQAVRIHQARGVDELVLLDIAATREGRGPDLGLVEELTKDCFMPLATGGGVRTIDDIRALLKAGSDKIIIGNAAWLSRIVRDAADTVGSQAIMVTCDVVEKLEDVDRLDLPGVRCMREAAPDRAKWIEEQGAGEILLNSVDREGMMAGYDLDTIRAVSKAVSIPVVAHGGCGTPAHMLEAIEAGADAVAAGAIFQFSDVVPADCARYLAEHGIETRLAA